MVARKRLMSGSSARRLVLPVSTSVNSLGSLNDAPWCAAAAARST
jgi:hypothetical protein